MRLRDLFNKRSSGGVGILIEDDICIEGYVPLSKNPEIVAGCRKIAELIGATTIHLMENTKDGDKRIINELSRKIDINPTPTMTRSNWMEYIVMQMLLYGRGNAIVLPHTSRGLLGDLEPISDDRFSFEKKGNMDYRVWIDGKPKNPQDLLHFVYNPDRFEPWKGMGVTVNLQDLAENLAQAQATKKAFLSSKWKPSIIVKVDALTDEFSSPEGRKKLTESYLKAEDGRPWIIPADQFQVEQVKPLTLNDLAIKSSVDLDKRTVASLLGVPAFLLGVGKYDQEEWNTFINTKIMSFCKGIAQELTRKLIISSKWYIKFNVWSLLDYDIAKISGILLDGADRGYLRGNEWRDRMNFEPADGLDEFKILENYIPIEDSGNQKKLKDADE